MVPEEPGGAGNPPAQPKSCKTQKLTARGAGPAQAGGDITRQAVLRERDPGFKQISYENEENRLPPGDGGSRGHRLAVLGRGGQRSPASPPLPPTSHWKPAASLFARTLPRMEKPHILKMLLITATLRSLGFVNYCQGLRQGGNKRIAVLKDFLPVHVAMVLSSFLLFSPCGLLPLPSGVSTEPE